MYSATYRGEDVAVKVLSHQTLSSKILSQFAQEVKNMNSIRSRYVLFLLMNFLQYSRYVVSLFGACTKEPHVGIVMELMEGGSLSDLLADEVELSWTTRLLMAADIARGIQVLHSNKPLVSYLHFFGNHSYLYRFKVLQHSHGQVLSLQNC